MEIESTFTRKQYMKLWFFQLIYESNFIVFFIFSLALLTFTLPLTTFGTCSAFGFLIVVILRYTIPFLSGCFSKKYKNFFSSKQFNFNDENIIVTVNSTEFIYRWNMFTKWVKTAGFYVLDLPDSIILVIPESDVRTNDLSEFEHLLETKIGTREPRIWSWNMKGTLTVVIVLSLVWLFSTFLSHYWGDRVLSRVFITVTCLVMIVPVALLVVEFYLVVLGKKSGNRLLKYIASGLLLSTMIVILLMIVDIIPLKTFL